METTEKILSGISDEEKGAYLSAIASIATADSIASLAEMEHLEQLCEAADLSEMQQQKVLNAAKETTEQHLVSSLDILKNSDLKYSLLADLYAFAKSDSDYSEAEQQSVQKIATYLGIDQTQSNLLSEVAEETNTAAMNPENASPSNFLSSGLGDRLKASGINSSGLLKGLISIAAPFIISRMMNRNRGGLTSGGGGLLGGGGGGLLGGRGGGLLGGGGLGSLISVLSGGRGMSGMGGLLSRFLR